MKKLILIEGLFGSGKTTITKKLYESLKSRNFKVKSFIEASKNNPVGLTMSIEEADNTIKSTSYESYPYETWSNLSINDGEYFIIEARLIQNSSFWAMLNGETSKNCLAIPQKIINSIPDDIEINVVLFKQSMVEEHINKVIKERKKKHPHWLPYICELFENQKWSKINNHSGYKGFIETQLKWSNLFTGIIEKIECNKIVITDPDKDWEKTLKLIENHIV